MSNDRGTRRRAAEQLPMVLVGIADPTRVGVVVHALRKNGLRSLIAFNAEDIRLQLDKPDGGQIALLILDAKLVRAGELAQLIADIRTRTRAPILTLGATAVGQPIGDFDLPPDANEQLISSNARSLVADRGQQPALTTWGPWRVDLSTWEASHRSIALPLTNQQLLLLDALVAAAGATVSPQELASRIYDDSMPFDGESLRAHMTRLRSRIRRASPDAAAALITIRGKGYRLAREPAGGR